jgi:D-alanine-D-alanine ligase
MRIIILHNRDHELLEEDPGREAREDVVHVAAALAEALCRGGAHAEPLALEGYSLDFIEPLRRMEPDLVFNLCESIAADSRGEMLVPCLLETLGLPYTGSSPLSLGLALYKDKAKELLRARGVSTPASARVDRPEQLAALELPFPLIVKPAREDGSVGVDFDSVVRDRAALERAVRSVLSTFRQPALVEQYVEGREIYVPLLGNHPRQVLPLSEICFGPYFEGRPRIVSYRSKWETDSPDFDNTQVEYCQLEPELHARLVHTARQAFEALECQDYGRVDMRVTADGTPYVIDINPNCDLHPQAGFARAAARGGLDYPALAARLVEIALERAHGNTPPRLKGSRAPRRAHSSGRHVLSGREGLRPRARRPGARARQP